MCRLDRDNGSTATSEGAEGIHHSGTYHAGRALDHTDVQICSTPVSSTEASAPSSWTCSRALMGSPASANPARAAASEPSPSHQNTCRQSRIGLQSQR